MIRRKRNVDKRRLADRLAVVARFNFSKFRRVLVDQIRRTQQQRRAFLRRLRRSGRERRTSRIDSLLHIVG